MYLSNPNELSISVKADNWDKYMDISANIYFNDFVGSCSLLFSQETQPAINPLFAKYVLSNIDICQLTNYFVMQAELWNNAGIGHKT
ncbi:hypothetical protein ACLKA6_010039 [Drosophila palustris]